jgi:hypothetical protein
MAGDESLRFAVKGAGELSAMLMRPGEGSVASDAGTRHKSRDQLCLSGPNSGRVTGKLEVTPETRIAPLLLLADKPGVIAWWLELEMLSASTSEEEGINDV